RMSAKSKDTDGGGESEAAAPSYEPGEPGGASPSSRPVEAGRDPRRRFSDRVDNYVKYRPTYPPAALDFLRQRGALAAESVVADVGSGTGISCRLFLDPGNTVYGVEPNADMRRAAERLLAGYPRFHSIDGSAE